MVGSTASLAAISGITALAVTPTLPGVAVITGLIVLNDGSLTTRGDVQIGDISGDSGTLDVAAGAGGAPTTLTAATITVGVNPDIALPQLLVGAPGFLQVTGGSLVQAAALDMVAATIGVDAASSVVVGNGVAVAGAVVVARTGTLASGGGGIAGNLDVDGVLAVAPDFGNGIVTAALVVTGGLAGIGAVGVLGTLEVADARAFNGSVLLGVASGPLQNGVLILDHGGVPLAHLSMQYGTVDLRDAAYTGAAPGYDPQTGLLTIGGDGLDVGRDQSALGFATAADGFGGTLVFASNIPCYAAGTRIATPGGEVPVEALRPGDLVATLDGVARPVRWVGRRRVDCTVHPRPAQVWPVRVAPHAFGQGLPARPLWLSPDHAVFADGLLVPIRCLINGASIRQERVERITYLHVELDQHDILLADGLPAESFLDTGNRDAFANGDGAMQLHPHFAGPADLWEVAGYAALTQTGPALAALQARLAVRATRLAA
jgi:Hint domain